MQTEEFTVSNVKCGGCVSAIQNGLKGLPGVEEVEVSIEGGRVIVTGQELSREQLRGKLTELGYPEA